MDHRSFFSLGQYVNELIQIIYFFERSSLKYCVVFIKHVAFFTIWANLTMAFTCTGLLLNLNTSVFGCGCRVSDLNKNFGGSTDLTKKKARIGGFAYPYSPPSTAFLVLSNFHSCFYNSIANRFFSPHAAARFAWDVVEKPFPCFASVGLCQNNLKSSCKPI